MTALDSCAVHYHITVVWRLLGLLPPPPAFLLQMTGVYLKLSNIYLVSKSWNLLPLPASALGRLYRYLHWMPVLILMYHIFVVVFSFVVHCLRPCSRWKVKTCPTSATFLFLTLWGEWRQMVIVCECLRTNLTPPVMIGLCDMCQWHWHLLSCACRRVDSGNASGCTSSSQAVAKAEKIELHWLVQGKELLSSSVVAGARWLKNLVYGDCYDNYDLGWY